MLFPIISLPILFAVNALSKEAEAQLKPYIHEGDKVVLLEPMAGTFALIQNRQRIDGTMNPNDPRSNGQCFGITQAQLALLSIEFKSGKRENDRSVIEKIKKAAYGNTNQIIYGYTREEFIREMIDHDHSPIEGRALQIAISELQANHAVKLNSDGSLEVPLPSGNRVEFPAAPNFTTEQVKSAETQAAEFMASIDKGYPLWGSSFPVERQSDSRLMTAQAGHAFVIVGYIKNDSEKVPSRIIVRDSNDPDHLRVISSSKSNDKLLWNDLDTAHPSVRQPVPVIVGTQNLSAAQNKMVHDSFEKTSNRVGVNSSKSLNPTRCVSGESLTDKIFNAAP